MQWIQSKITADLVHNMKQDIFSMLFMWLQTVHSGISSPQRIMLFRTLLMPLNIIQILCTKLHNLET